MQVIPVIDLMRGEVVRGVGGRRDEYRPIVSVLSADARPQTVGRALAAAGFDSIYVADLDAIGGGQPAWKTYELLAACGLELWIDAGLTSAADAHAMAEFRAGGKPLAGIVAGLESLAGPQELEAMVRSVGADRLIFSVDLRAGEPIVRTEAWLNLNARQIASLALRFGVRRMIVLDLTNVGMGQGVCTLSLCRELHCLDDAVRSSAGSTPLQLIAGGGVRSMGDLRAMAATGCDAALVASALHDGRITPGECQRTLWKERS